MGGGCQVSRGGRLALPWVGVGPDERAGRLFAGGGSIPALSTVETRRGCVRLTRAGLESIIVAPHRPIEALDGAFSRHAALDEAEATFVSLQHRKIGRVTALKERQAGATTLEVELNGQRANAVNYDPLTGSVEIGDSVLLNTTAVELGLGTGGVHFVAHNLTRMPELPQSGGHIMKLRYTAHQFNVLAAEEEESPYHSAVRRFEGLKGMPVMLGTLHSMIAPAAVAFKHEAGRPRRLVYLMTDSAALPLGLSRLVRTLRDAGFLDATITVGQAFGGEYECVNLHSGLATARQVCRADAVIVAPGPGHVGTGTKYGFSGIEQAYCIDAVDCLGGVPLPILRVSYADHRHRHRGVSHHSQTILGELTKTRTTIALPRLEDTVYRLLMRQLKECGILARHDVWEVEADAALRRMTEARVHVTSMGRSLEEDPEFFLTCAAAGVYAAERLP
ncbi:MAG: DUF3866 domain-containing protein [Armatimonadetes bacterium CG17_big_fil_post_rev_8_21_14_2_50_66_6]|nr:MAG: DUF3866 domain-containing protein [Armatimonadetes bacterium CG17_big_fil_post_rev_8_21_14_2_50_66_6]